MLVTSLSAVIFNIRYIVKGVEFICIGPIVQWSHCQVLLILCYPSHCQSHHPQRSHLQHQHQLHHQYPFLLSQAQHQQLLQCPDHPSFNNVLGHHLLCSQSCNGGVHPLIGLFPLPQFGLIQQEGECDDCHRGLCHCQLCPWYNSLPSSICTTTLHLILVSTLR